MASQARLTLPEHGGSLIKRLAAEGLLDPLFSFAQASRLHATISSWWSATGTGVVLDSQGNPKSNGLHPIRALQEARCVHRVLGVR